MRSMSWVLAFCGCILSGCAVVPNIFNQATPIQGTSSEVGVLTVDAKQRLLLMSRQIQAGEEKIRICADVAPDVFSVLSSSLSAQADSTKPQGDKALSLALAFAMSETGAAIQRSQTINLLAMSMYRTCERYLSGGIGEAAFFMQAYRDHRAMVAILAIEQVTSLGRMSAPIVISGGSAAGGTGSDMESLARAKETADKAKADAIKKKAAFDEALNAAPDPGAGKTKSCDGIPAAEADKLKACKSAMSASKLADEVADREEKHYLALRGLASTGVSASAGNDSIKVAAATTERLDPSVVQHITSTVEKLAALGMQTESPYDLCVQASFSRGGSAGESTEYGRQSLRDCRDILGAAGGSPVAAMSAVPIEKAKWSAYSSDLFIQIARPEQRVGALAINEGVTARITGLRVNDVELVRSSPKSTQVRYYYDTDKSMVEKVVDLVKHATGRPVTCIKMDESWAAKVKPGLIELWIAAGDSVDATKAARGPETIGNGCSS